MRNIRATNYVQLTTFGHTLKKCIIPHLDYILCILMSLFEYSKFCRFWWWTLRVHCLFLDILKMCYSASWIFSIFRSMANTMRSIRVKNRYLRLNSCLKIAIPNLFRSQAAYYRGLSLNLKFHNISSFLIQHRTQIAFKFSKSQSMYQL